MTDTACEDTWSAREYPVLVVAASHVDQHPSQMLRSDALATRVGMDHEDVKLALVALTPTYLTTTRDERGDSLNFVRLLGITDEGRRAAGLWPARDDHLASLIAALNAAADGTDDPEERTLLRRVGAGLSAVPGSILSGVVTTWLGAQM